LLLHNCYEIIITWSGQGHAAERGGDYAAGRLRGVELGDALEQAIGDLRQGRRRREHEVGAS
jgi:hypothetical protein